MSFIKLTHARSNRAILIQIDHILGIAPYHHDMNESHILCRDETTWHCKEAIEEIEALLEYNELILLNEDDIEEDISE